MSYEQRRDEYLAHIKNCRHCVKWWNRRVPFGKITSVGYTSVKLCLKARELVNAILK